ncbi:unnamed protein product [Urochloa humidicola]
MATIMASPGLMLIMLGPVVLVLTVVNCICFMLKALAQKGRGASGSCVMFDILRQHRFLCVWIENGYGWEW